MKKNENKMSLADSIRIKKYLLEYLEDHIRTIENREKDARCSYEEVGREEQQATDWKTGELRWEDEEHTIPYHKPIYDYVPKRDEDLTDDDKAQLEALETIKKALEALI